MEVFRLNRRNEFGLSFGVFEIRISFGTTVFFDEISDFGDNLDEVLRIRVPGGRN